MRSFSRREKACASSKVKILEGELTTLDSRRSRNSNARRSRSPIKLLRSLRFKTSALEVRVLQLSRADETLRRSVEALLHEAWHYDRKAQNSISLSLGLSLNGMKLRSGRCTARCQVSTSGSGGQWLIWEQVGCEVHGSKVVGALVLRQQSSGKRGAPLLIDYVSARRSLGGRAWPMIVAAEDVCRKHGSKVLYSAADLTQDGSNSDPVNSSYRPSAVEAHRRWGFTAISAQEWKNEGLDLYDDTRCCVCYMRKDL